MKRVIPLLTEGNKEELEHIEYLVGNECPGGLGMISCQATKVTVVMC